MKRVNPHIYVELGLELGQALALDKNTGISFAFFELLNLGASLDILLESSALISKSIVGPMRDLNKTIKRIYDADDETNGTPNDLSLFQGSLHRDIKNLQTALKQGLPLLNLYSASPQGTQDIGLLIDGAAQSTFGDYFSEIDPQVIRDFDEAGKCLAFALYTATGYHAARACEGMLRTYAEEFLSVTDIEKLETMGAIIHKLRKVKGDAEPDRRIVDRADRVREYDRNVLMHPGQFLSDFDARSTFAIAGELVNMIAARKHQLAIARALSTRPKSSDAIPPALEGNATGRSNRHNPDTAKD